MSREKLIEAVASDNERAIISALLRAEERGPKAGDLLPEIMALLGHSSADLRGLAACAYLAISGKPGIPKVLPLLQDVNPITRTNAAGAIASAGGKQIAYPFIREMLGSSERAMRKAAESLTNYLDADFAVDRLCEEELRPHQLEEHDITFNEKSISSFLLKSGHEITLRMFVCSDRELDSLRESVLSTIRELDRSFFDHVACALMGTVDESDDPSQEDDRETILPYAATIPPHKAGPNAFFIIEGESDHDIEHGFDCLVKNMAEFCFVSRDFTSQVSAKASICDIVLQFDKHEKFPV